MYNHYLDTFVAVADLGSFAKAAEALFITRTAVVKKINGLEARLGLELFVRSNQGVTLTGAGATLYKDAKYIINYSKTAVARAKNCNNQASNIIRIGKSLNTPCDILEEIWPQVQKCCPELKLNIIPFENTTEAVNDMFKNLGRDIDAYIGLVDPAVLSYRKCIGLRLKTEPLKIAFPASHRFSSKKKIRMRDLYGEKLMLVQKGRFVCYDNVRDYIAKNHPLIEIVDCETIEISAFNRCVNSDGIIVILEPWKKIHPLFKTVQVPWDYTGDWGIVCATKPSPQVVKFLDVVACILGLTEEDFFEGFDKK